MSAAANGALTLSYALEAELSRVRIPPICPPRRADKLWQHTCFEVFFGVGASDAYREFNFSPSTEWAAYAYSGYREGMALMDEECAPKVVARCSDERFELTATVRIAPPLHLALAAVIEEEDGRLSYWALRHPSDKPDFHHPQSFALEF